MNRNLRWRQREDEPSVAGVYWLEPQYFTQERAVCPRVLAVYDDVRAKDHGCGPFSVLTAILFRATSTFRNSPSYFARAMGDSLKRSRNSSGDSRASASSAIDDPAKSGSSVNGAFE